LHSSVFDRTFSPLLRCVAYFADNAAVNCRCCFCFGAESVRRRDCVVFISAVEGRAHCSFVLAFIVATFSYFGGSSEFVGGVRVVRV